MPYKRHYYMGVGPFGPQLMIEDRFESPRMEPFTAEESKKIIEGIDLIASYVTYPIRRIFSWFCSNGRE